MEPNRSKPPLVAPDRFSNVGDKSDHGVQETNGGPRPTIQPPGTIGDWNDDSPASRLFAYYSHMVQRGKDVAQSLVLAENSPGNQVLASYQRQWQRWQNVVRSMSLDSANAAEVAREDIQLIHDNMTSIVLTLGGVAAVTGLFAWFAPEVAAVSPEAAAIVEGIKVMAAKSRIIAMGANVGVHIQKWFWSAWTAKTPEDLKVANKLFIDLLVVMAVPPGQRAGVPLTAPATTSQTMLPALVNSGVPALRLAGAGVGSNASTGALLLPHFAMSNDLEGVSPLGPSPEGGGAFETPSIWRPEPIVEVRVSQSRVEQMLQQVPPEMLAKLNLYRFDPALFAQFAERAPQNVPQTVTGEILPLQVDDLTVMPSPGTHQYTVFDQLGRDAIKKGKAGVAIIAGGMATRYKGVVKAGAPVADGVTFLAAKVADVRALSPDIPIYVMTSAATHDAIVRQIAEEGFTGVHCFPQFASLRFTPTGDLFLEDGQPSVYATGHGDLMPALRASGLLDQFIAGGGEYLLMSNIDNIGARLNPAVLGSHIASGAEVTAEVVQKQQGDAGGAPARVGNRPQIIEGFRFPATFRQEILPQFSPNTIWFNARVANREIELPFFRVEKTVQDKKAIQFERLVGQILEFLSPKEVHLVQVGRDRFIPIKVPEDRFTRKDEIDAVLQDLNRKSR